MKAKVRPLKVVSLGVSCPLCSFLGLFKKYLRIICAENTIFYVKIHKCVSFWVAACHPSLMVGSNTKQAENHWVKASKGA